MRELFLNDAEPEKTGAPARTPNCALEFDPHNVFWAMRNIPVGEASKSFLISGAPGSGKTVGIQLLLQSIAPRFKEHWHTPEQLIIFDAKGDTLPLLAALGLRPEYDNFHIFNPLDTRASVWELDAEVENPAMARALAKLLIPPDDRSTAPYFSEAAAEVVYSVIITLNAIKRRRGKKWTFRDLLCALDSPYNILQLIKQNESAARHVAPFLNDDKHYLAIISSIAAKVGRFDQVAALWRANPNARKFSVAKFLDNPGVLVLGNDPVLKDTVWPINAILLKAITNEILRRDSPEGPRHWFVLDEFRAMENVDCIHNLLNRGRSKGACVVLGIQTVEGIMDVYGGNGANDLLGMCAYKTFLRAGSHWSAEWAEQYFGKVRQQESSFSRSSGAGSSSTSISYQVQERSQFLGSTFLDLPFPRAGGTYEAICDVPFTRETIITRRSCDEVFKWCKKPDEEVPAFDPVRDPDAQVLQPWTDAQALQFGVPPLPQDSGKSNNEGKKSDQSSSSVPKTDAAGSPAPSSSEPPPKGTPPTVPDFPTRE